MPDPVSVTVDPPSVSVKPGQRALIGVAVQNLTDNTEQYELAIEGADEARQWVEIQLYATVLQAFPTEFARASVRLSPPIGWPGRTYNLRLRARSRSGKSSDGFAALDVTIVAPSPGPSTTRLGPRPTEPVDQTILKTSPTIVVEAEEVSNSTLPSPAGQWSLQLRNAGSRQTTFGFGVFGLTPRMVSVEPAEIPLRPGETGTATLTVQLDSETAPGPKSFYLMTYSFLNLDERTEVPLRLVVQPPAEPSPGPPVAPGWLKVAVDNDFFAVDPGITKHVNLTIQNLRGQAIAPELRVVGTPARWYRLGVAAVSVPGRQSVAVDVAVTAPEIVPVGAYPLSIRGDSSEFPQAAFKIDLLLEVLKSQGGPIRLAVDPKLLTVLPGNIVNAKVTVLNRMADPASVQLEVSGIDSDWFQVGPIHPIDGGQQGSVAIQIQPPGDLTRSTAGVYPIRLQASSRQAPGQPGEADAELTVQLVGEYAVAMGPAELSTARGARYPLRVQNQTNAPLSLRFTASDSAGALGYTFEQTEWTVPPFSNQTKSLTITALEIVSAARSVDFKVEVTGEQILGGGGKRSALVPVLAGRLFQVAASPVIVTISPPSANGKDRGEFEVRVNNPGTIPATIALAAADAEGALSFEFFPEVVALDPGGNQVARLMTRTKEFPSSGERKEYRFSVTAKPGAEADVSPSTGNATLVTERRGCLVLAPPMLVIGFFSSLAGGVGLKGLWKSLIIIPALIFAAAMAFVMSGGRTSFDLSYMLPAPILGLLQHAPRPTLPGVVPPAIGSAVPGLAAPNVTPVSLAVTVPSGGPTTVGLPTAKPAANSNSAANGTSNGAGNPSSNASGSAAGNPTTTVASNASSSGSGNPTPTVASNALGSASGNPTPTVASNASATTSGTAASSTPSSADAQAQAMALVTSKNYTVADTSTYGTVGPLHVLIGAATGGDGHSQLAYIFYNSTYLGTDALDPSGQITFAGWKDGKTFVLRYGLYKATDPLCCPTGGTADVILMWSDADGKIVTIGQIPPAAPSASQPLARR